MSIHRNATYALAYGLNKILNDGDDVTVRDMKTKELLSVSLKILKPEERCFVIPKRNDNIFAKIAETLWMLAGRNDIEWLSYYLPRAPQFADDGKYWRGAYGPRLRGWLEYDGLVAIDQLQYVIDLLRKDPLSRQAVISIWDPGIDTTPGKDIPCNNWLHFLIRDKKLHMNVAQRSSDILWGFSGIDTFSWSVLHQMMAFWTGTEVGTLNYFISSWHLYEQHWKRGKDIFYSFLGTTIYDQGYTALDFSVPWSELDYNLTKIFLLEERARNGKLEDSDTYEIDDNFLWGCLEMLRMYTKYNTVLEHCGETTLRALARDLELFPKSDFQIAAIEYFLRKNKKLLDYLDVPPLSFVSYVSSHA